MSSLLESLNSKDWQRSFDLCWAEFWDMHALFETAEPPFSYMKPKSLEVLEFVSDYWSQKKDGPLVTMDAGANVHFLFRPDQEDVVLKFSEHFPSRIVSSTLRR
jgi:diphosphomevalonate decarboxylase